MEKVVNLLTSPKFHIWFNLILLFVWIVLIVPSLLFWKNSVPFLVFVSVYALVVSHGAALMAALAEKSAVDTEEKSKERDAN